MRIEGLIKQKEYEKVEYVLRRHPITFVPYVALFIVLLAVPLVLYFLLTNLFPQILNGHVLYPLLVLFASIYCLSILLFFYAQFIEFYLDLWIITNDRMIDIEQFGIFSRSVSEVDLFRIQDVTTNVSGLFATFFKYGDVSVNTASVNINIVARKVPFPNKIREELIRLAHEDRKYHISETIETST